MISYKPFWELLRKKNITIYKIQKDIPMSSRTLERLKNDESITVNTINSLCEYLDVDVNKIMTYVDDEKYINENYLAYYGTDKPKITKRWGLE